MGKATGFMELDRVERDYETVEDRIKHFKEFMIKFNDFIFQNKNKENGSLRFLDSSNENQKTSLCKNIEWNKKASLFSFQK